MSTSRKVIKKLLGLLTVLATMLIMTSIAEASWWQWEWRCRKKLTFDTTTISQDLTNFPVLVALNSTNFSFSKARDNGEDIRFIDADGTNVLSHEIEKWDKAGQSAWVWAKVPKIDAGISTDFIYIYYGNAEASDGQNTTNVWDSYFVMVQHMKDDPDASYTKDSTSNTNDGTKTATNEPVETPNGKIGPAQDFDGTNDYVLIQADSSLSCTQAFSIEAWVKLDSCPPDISSTGAGILTGRDGKNQNKYTWHGYSVYVTSGTSVVYRAIFNAIWRGFVAGSTIPLGGFVYIAYTYNASTRTQTFYINENTNQNVHPEDYDKPTGTEKVSIGWQSNDTVPLDGVIDEVRFSNTTRSPDWIKACYINQNYFSTFCTMGKEEARPGGVTIVIR